MLLKYSIKYFRKWCCPTCVSSFPIAEFCIYIQTTRCILSLRTWLYWMGIVELGHWCLYSRLFPINLSVYTLLCLKIHLKKKKKKHHPYPRPVEWGLYCFVHVCVGHIASHGKPTPHGCEITTYKTSLKTSSSVLCHPVS